MNVCMYACSDVIHVFITHAHYAIDTVKIVSIDHLLSFLPPRMESCPFDRMITLNVAHQQLKPSLKERLFEDLEETR